jgi:malate dehydrogenase (quinone)
MLQVLEKCFAQQLQTEAWQQKLREMIPSYGQSLVKDPELLKQVRAHTLSTLQIK